MATSYTQFKVELYEEHIEEASFLFDQKLTYLFDTEIAWIDLEYEESRLEAHIDALIIGEDLALKTLIAVLEDGEPGVIYTAATLFCFRNDLQGFFSIFPKVDLASADVIQALTLALLEHCPEDWIAPLLKYNFANQADLLPIFLPFFAHKRVMVPNGWCEIALQQPIENKIPIIHACGLLKSSNTRNSIAQSIVDHENQSEQYAAITSLLLQGYPQAIDYTLHHIPFNELPWSAIALGCKEPQAQQLAAIRADQWTPEAIKALGLLGQSEFAPILIGLLSNEELAPSVARSLYILTGQYLTQEVFVEERWDEDQLFEEELEEFKQGKVPTTADGQPFGENIEQLSTDQALWAKWWQENQNQFQAGLRYRLGRPLTPSLLVTTLIQPHADFALREHSYFELVIRYQCPIPFSPMLSVIKQKQQIQKIYEWAESIAIQPGHYH